MLRAAIINLVWAIYLRFVFDMTLRNLASVITESSQQRLDAQVMIRALKNQSLEGGIGRVEGTSDRTPRVDERNSCRR